ncbi:MAG TPA: hypothetical protein VGC76_20310 [Pyrinomonadaceae bacterium]|jgi:hypothetical protein
MRKVFLILSVFILMAFIALPGAFGQKKQRVKFGRGAVQTTISGKLNGYKDKQVYVIKVRKGQTLNTEQIKSDASTHYVTVEITSPSGEDVSDSDASCNDMKEVTPTAAGDYLITVYECQKADRWRGSFKLKVSVK